MLSEIKKDKIDKLWEESSQNVLIQTLNAKKNILEVINVDYIKEMFSVTPCCLGCADGRIHEHRLGRAGMGILAGPEITSSIIKRKIDLGELSKKGLEITSHSGCGAANIVCKQMIKDGKIAPNTDPDSIGIDFAKKVIIKLKELGIKASYRHIEAKEMDEIHNERCIYFDGTGKINIEQKFKNFSLPRGFILSDLNFDLEITLTELKALCGIALSDHGFGNKFSEKNPFYILISAVDEKQFQKLKKISQKSIENIKSVKIIKFVTLDND